MACDDIWCNGNEILEECLLVLLFLPEEKRKESYGPAMSRGCVAARDK